MGDQQQVPAEGKGLMIYIVMEQDMMPDGTAKPVMATFDKQKAQNRVDSVNSCTPYYVYSIVSLEME
jgi:hypothetical protein